MKNVFSEFWRVNLGHVAIAAIFLFGLGVSWSQQTSRVDLLDQRETSREGAITIALANAVKEREAQFRVIDSRLELVERWQRDAEAILKALEAMRVEQRHTNESLKEIREDLKEVRNRFQK